MLILARRIGESIMIGDQVEISVVDIKGDQVKLGIKAPSQVKVYRREVYAAIQEENRAAAAAAPGTLPRLEGLLEPGRTGPGAGTPPGGPGKATPGPDNPAGRVTSPGQDRASSQKDPSQKNPPPTGSRPAR
jgi:carbon storage regulator